MAASSAFPSKTQKLFLLDLPNELQMKIYALASRHEEPISPELWLPMNRSHVNNTFAHGLQYLDPLLASYLDPDRNKGHRLGTLSAEDLAATCKSVRKLVLGTELLFYKLNTFDFTCMSSMHRYLAAITPSRRNAIKSIRVIFDIHNDPQSAFIMLSVCHGLEDLTLDITLTGERFRNHRFLTTPGIHELVKLRGLKSFKLTYGDRHPRWNFLEYVHDRIRNEQMTSKSEMDLGFEVAILERIIQDIVSRGTKASCDITQQAVQEAIRSAKVNPRVDEFLLQPISTSSRAQRSIDRLCDLVATMSASLNPPIHGADDAGNKYSDISSGITKDPKDGSFQQLSGHVPHTPRSYARYLLSTTPSLSATPNIPSERDRSEII